MTKVVVLGARGQLGSALVDAMAARGGFKVTALGREDLDVGDHARTRKVLAGLGADFVVNTTAFHRVDACEDEVAESFRINAEAVKNLAIVTRDQRAALVHLSTDFVFGLDGARNTPYLETEAPGPQSIYASSKLAGEYAALSYGARSLVVRSCGLYNTSGSRLKGGNFVEIMLKVAAANKPLKVVNDQRLSPTYAVDLAGKIVDLMSAGATGLFHVTNAGDVTWYEFAQTIFELAGVAADLSPTTTAEYGAKAPRPAYSVLSNHKLHALGISPMRPWRDALTAYLKKRKSS